MLFLLATAFLSLNAGSPCPIAGMNPPVSQCEIANGRPGSTYHANACISSAPRVLYIIKVEDFVYHHDAIVHKTAVNSRHSNLSMRLGIRTDVRGSGIVHAVNSRHSKLEIRTIRTDVRTACIALVGFGYE